MTPTAGSGLIIDHIGECVIIWAMSALTGYMVTWTTYGSWLQGDERGYVKHGRTILGNNAIRQANLNTLKIPPVVLTKPERRLVYETIVSESKAIDQEILALTVCSDHVHLTARPCGESIEEIVSRYKNKAMFALRKYGRNGRIWTRGFDKRFCFTNEQLSARITYIWRHRNA